MINDSIFIICSMSSARQYISFLYLKPFKIHFYGFPPPLGYTLVCKKHIYIQKMTLSSLLTWIPSFCMKFVKFLYKSCFVMNLIPIWPQSHKLLFLRLADFCKKMLMSVKFSAITSNFYKFSETTSHCEIAYQI